MRKRVINGIILAIVLAFGLSFFGCMGGAGGGGDTSGAKNYNADVKVVAPEEIDTEHFVLEEDTTYYTSPGFSLWMEVNGAFLEMDYFYLDGNKRVYDNLYFYEDDYFYIVTDDYKDLYASLGDSADKEYAEEEKEQGYDIQLNVKKSGIYKLVFDLDTLKFDMEYKSEITTPVYYTIKNCQIYTTATNWVDMSVNPNNKDEFVINDFYIGVNQFVSFQDRTHTSLYKNTVDVSCAEKYATYQYPTTMVNVGGNYNVYINAKTYVVRFELLNPDTAEYTCVYYNGADFIELSPQDSAVPYIFKQRVYVDTNYTTSVPKFHTKKYRTYNLTVVPSSAITSTEKYHYFKKIGTYDLTINLKTFELSVELLSE